MPIHNPGGKNNKKALLIITGSHLIAVDVVVVVKCVSFCFNFPNSILCVLQLIIFTNHCNLFSFLHRIFFVAHFYLRSSLISFTIIKQKQKKKKKMLRVENKIKKKILLHFHTEFWVRGGKWKMKSDFFLFLK